MPNLYILVALFYFIHYGSSQEGDNCFSPKWLDSVLMSMKIAKTGFHRDLQYGVGYGKSHHNVKALLVQKLPSGVYMDEYQLATLRQDTGLEVLLDSKVDLEAPEYLSSGFTAHIFLAPSSELSKRLEATVPIHGRYHRPSNSSHRWVKVEIGSPKLLLRSDRCKTPPPSLYYKVVDAPCTFSNLSMCLWLEIQGLKETVPVSLEIPVGDSSLTITVCVVTVLVTLLSSIYLLRTIWKHGTF